MKKLLTTVIAAAIYFALSSCVMVNTAGYHYDNYDQYKTGGAEIKDEVQNIEVDWISGEVLLIETENTAVSFEEKSSHALRSQDKMRYWYESSSKTLHIKFCEPIVHSIETKEKDLFIYVPQNYAFNEVLFNVVSANIKMNNINAAVFDIDSVSGDVQITTNSTESIFLNSVSGNVTVNAANVSSLEFDTVSGDLEVSINTGKEIEMESVSGDLDLYLAKELGFNIYAETNGSVDYNMEVGGRGDVYTYGSQELQVNYESISGDISINN